MNTSKEHDILLTKVASDIAEDLIAQRIKINAREVIAIISTQVHRMARAGRTIEDIEAALAGFISINDILDGVAVLVNHVIVEANFIDGPKTVIIRNPIN